MKSTITYTCDICNSIYSDINKCKECENKGIPKPKYQKGQIFKYDSRMIFVIIEQVVIKHDVEYRSYIFRDMPNVGDSTRLECTPTHEDSVRFNLGRYKIDKNMPAYRRLKKFCKDNDIEIIDEGVKYK